jgi:hypothetical protein
MFARVLGPVHISERLSPNRVHIQLALSELYDFAQIDTISNTGGTMKFRRQLKI